MYHLDFDMFAVLSMLTRDEQNQWYHKTATYSVASLKTDLDLFKVT